jgi:hypothetical protein
LSVMRCPVCKVENNQGPQCRRCKADLMLLFTVEDQREQALAEARRCLAQSRWRRAAEYAVEAGRLRRGDDVRRVEAVARMLGRDFAGAWRVYRGRGDQPVG